MTFPGNGPSSLTGKTPACRLDIFIRIGKEHCNSWKIWVYPEDTRVDFGDVRFTADYNEALELLGKGSKVLFNPAELSGFEEMQDVFGTAENTKQDASGIYSSAFINTKGVGRKN